MFDSHCWLLRCTLYIMPMLEIKHVIYPFVVHQVYVLGLMEWQHGSSPCCWVFSFISVSWVLWFGLGLQLDFTWTKHIWFGCLWFCSHGLTMMFSAQLLIRMPSHTNWVPVTPHFAWWILVMPSILAVHQSCVNREMWTSLYAWVIHGIQMTSWA